MSLPTVEPAAGFAAPELDPFVPPKLAAYAARRPEPTIWTWQRRMAVTSACDVRSRQVIVRLEEVIDLARRKATA